MENICVLYLCRLVGFACQGGSTPTATRHIKGAGRDCGF